LNFAENLLRNLKDSENEIIISTAEHLPLGQEWRISGKELYGSVSRCAKAMCNLGILKGDVIAAYAPNITEVVVFMLAAASIGALFTTIPPDFGVEATVDRISQTKPKLLLVANAVFYNGKVHDCWTKCLEIVQSKAASFPICLL